MIIADKNMVDVPEQFRKIRYKRITPLAVEDNVEEHFYRFWQQNNFNSERVYLPVFWTDYYYRNGHAKCIEELQKFLNELPNDKKYFTIIQYDDGICNNISHLDLYVFSSAGCGTKTIPWIEYNISQVPMWEKPTWVHFRGHRTHPMRELILNSSLKNDIRNIISDAIISIDEYLKETGKTTFVLCPRGYGRNSFRFYEAFATGSIPVYIYDELILPYQDEINWEEISILLHYSEFSKLNDILNLADITSMRAKGKIIYEKYLTFDAVTRYIYEKIKRI